MNKFKIVLSFFLIFALIHEQDLALAKGDLKFELSNKKIDRVCQMYSEVNSNNCKINIVLKEPYKSEFSNLTKANINKNLVIIFSDEILIEAIIEAQIDTGIIEISKSISEHDCKAFIETLQANKVEGCGNQFSTQIKFPLKDELIKEAQLYYGKFYEDKNADHLNKALYLINEAIQVDKTNMKNYYWKALILAKLNHYDSAKTTITSGLKINPNKDDPQMIHLIYLRGLLNHKQDLLDESNRDYDEIIKLSSFKLNFGDNDWETVLLVSQILCLQNKKVEALELIETKMKESPTDKYLKQIETAIKNFDIDIYLNNF